MYVLITEGSGWYHDFEGRVFEVNKVSHDEKVYYVDPEGLPTGRRYVKFDEGKEIDLPSDVTVDNDTGYLTYAGEEHSLVRRQAEVGDLVLITYFDWESIAEIREVDRMGNYALDDFYLDEGIGGENFLDSRTDLYYVLVPAGEEEEEAEFEPMETLPEIEEGTPGLRPELTDFVNHPDHYTTGRFEVIEMIEEITKGYDDSFVAYNIGNVQKYIARAPHKGKLIEDLEKARKYLDFAIDYLEGDVDA